MDTSVDTLKRYQRYFGRLLKLEREEEINFHWNEIRSLSGLQRQNKGRAVLDLSGREAGRGLGGIFLVKLSKSKGLPDTEIGIGDLVIVSSGFPNGNEAQATLVEKSNYSITVAYNNTPPSYVFGNQLRLDLFANDVSFQRMMEALHLLKEHQVISDLLLIQRQPRFSEERSNPVVNQQLNESQQNAVRKSLDASDIFLIHGPPGTGKTTTLVESVLQHIQLVNKVLVSADSNIAVDNLVEKLVARKCHVIRLGNPARLNPDLAGYSLDHLILEIDEYQQAAAMRDQIGLLREKQKDFVVPTGPNRRGLSDDEIIKLAKRGSTSRGVSLPHIRKMAEWLILQRQIGKMMGKINQLEEKAVRQLIKSADAVCATNVTAGSEVLRDFKFDVAFIDEATQSMEPSCIIPMVKAQKWVMAGDHKQLPPTVLSQDAGALNNTLFERWINGFGKQVSAMLTIQYRMNKQIMAFSNHAFYDGKLKASSKVNNHHIGQLSGYRIPDHLSNVMRSIITPEYPVCFVQVKASMEDQLSSSFSYFNKAEVAVVKKVIETLVHCRLFPGDIGVISPYEQQVNLLRIALQDFGVEIKTVDGYQGREKEVIVLSLVRANEQGNLGFLTDYRRLNVAMTRARRKLIIIGHKNTLQTNTVYTALLETIPCQVEM